MIGWLALILIADYQFHWLVGPQIGLLVIDFVIIITRCNRWSIGLQLVCGVCVELIGVVAQFCNYVVQPLGNPQLIGVCVCG